MTISDQVLLDRFASTRDGESFAELVRRHSGMVYGVCRRVLNDRTLAEDAAQETFLHLLRQPAAVSESLVGWLHRVAHHKAVDLVRREVSQARRAETSAQTPSAAPAAGDEPTWATLSPLLDEALQELPIEARAILIAHYLEARSQQELAQELGLSQPTVSRRLAAAVAQLRGLLIAKGVVATAVLACLIQGTACATAPATLTLELGKLTLAGQAGLGAGIGAAKVATATATAAKAATSVTAASASLIALAAAGIAAGAWLFQHHASARTVSPRSVTAWRFVAPDVPAMVPSPAPTLPVSEIGRGGPARLLALSRLGGTEDDAIIGVAIAPDWTLLVAGNAGDLAVPAQAETELGMSPASGPPRHPSANGSRGFIARLAADGRSLLGITRIPLGVTLSRLRTDPRGDLLVAGSNAAGADLGGGPGSGGFIAKLSADARRLMWILYQDGIVDYAADANGDLLVLNAAQLIRYDSATGHQRWQAAWTSHGPDHPGALAVDGHSGIAVVAGCSEASTGDEVFKQPYAHAFDRDGAASWTLWDADPVTLRSRPPGLHLNADGWAARLISGGGVLSLAMVSSGGNTVLAHDPRDPLHDHAAGIVAAVHQASPGYGFSGATPVSTLVRVDPVRGTVLRQTWITAWKSPAQASAWALADACADGGLICAVGESASGGPARAPWYATAAGGPAGGSIALFDEGLGLLQAGTFPQAHWTCAAMRGSTLIVAGDVATGAPAPTVHAIQDAPGGGRDGYVAVFALDRPLPAGTSP
jgi:RNA polymerase sigma factor (sigma-70 family)